MTPETDKEDIMTKLVLCLVTATLVLYAGCGGNDGSEENSRNQPAKAVTAGGDGAATRLWEPCELITRAEAGSLIGAEVRDGQYGEQKAVGMKKCFYEALDSDTFLQITVQQPEFMPPRVLTSGQSPRTLFAETKTMLADGRIDLLGLGDDAFIGTGGLYLLIGDCHITIGVGNPARDGNRQKLEAAGRLVLEKLKR
jgi:hypothetical protein